MTLAVRLAHRRGAFALAVDLEVPSRGVTAVLGASGAGKSTLLHAVAGLLRPAEGRIVLDGRVLLDTERRLVVPARRRRMACVFQDARLFPHLDVRRNLRFGIRRRRTPLTDDTFDGLVAVLGLEALLSRRPATLSGGERQRVAIGRALLSDPDLLLLDEPLAALDAPRRREILATLARLRDEAAVPMLYVTHRREEIARLADRVVVLEAGRSVADGAVGDVLTRLELADRFDGGPESVLEATIRSQEPEWALTSLAWAGGTLQVPAIAGPPGSAVRLSIRAEDVLLATEAPAALSAANRFRARVTNLREDDGPWADVRLACGDVHLVARITRRSRARLGLVAGSELWALVKTATLVD